MKRIMSIGIIAAMLLVTSLTLFPETTVFANVSQDSINSHLDVNGPDDQLQIWTNGSGMVNVAPAEWNNGNQKSIITVGNSLATLYTDHGKKIQNRSLGKKSPWFTDKFRLNGRTGEILYHVSTSEWVSSNDINSVHRLPDTSNPVVFKTVQDLGTTVITFNGTENSWTVFEPNGTVSKKQIFGGNSYYATKEATDSQGNQFYLINNDEWVEPGLFCAVHSVIGAQLDKPASYYGS